MPISYLNDFIFCPYSLYLHQVFDDNKEEVYSALPQQRGKAHHIAIDSDGSKTSSSKSILKGAYVISNRLGIYGKIDTLYIQDKKLVENKYTITKIYQGYYYQIWAQYFALIEMGYSVKELSFFSIKDRKSYQIKIPEEAEFEKLRHHIRLIARFDFEQDISINPIKCKHCIYASLCDKTNTDHVYA